MDLNIKIAESWKYLLKDEFNKEYFFNIVHHLKTEKQANKIIYPKGSQIFNAFEKTNVDNTKVVILGQDPYHNPNQAMGLSFSVPKDESIPRSLQNIYIELKNDLGLAIPNHGDLTHWASQGVLLLNTILTVRKNEPASHSKIGWMNFTDAVIKNLSKQKNNLVFILWGKFAQEKEILIDNYKHLILKAAHPSPFSADKGFFGCKHFSKCNDYLVKNKIEPIDWQVI